VEVGKAVVCDPPDWGILLLVLVVLLLLPPQLSRKSKLPRSKVAALASGGCAVTAAGAWGG